MSRILKFRAWTGRVCLYPPELGEWDFEDCELFAGYNKKPTVLQQFTGLHDKNGKEIYEGDLIRTYINLIFVVKFTMGAFWIEWINKSESEDTALQLLSAKNTSSVVIGNRFENPELLEEVK